MTDEKKLRIKDKIWIEKFRPDTLSDVIGHKEIMLRLKAFVKAGDALEFLFTGPPASGKTTAAIAFAKDLYGKDWDRNFTELNASDERGIDMVRTKIKSFAGNKPINAPFKIIFLDEVDELCLPEGTLVLTGYGGHTQHTKIEDIPQDKYIPMQSVNLDSKEIEEDTGMCVDSGRAEFYKITLSDGRTVTASEKHPFFVSGYKFRPTRGLTEIQMKDIKVNDEIIDYSIKLNLRPPTGDPFECDNPSLAKVIKKEYVGEGKAYNITMENNPCFFLHNGILTHNTKPAQAAMRRTIEKYSNTCRFILSCNYDNKLIPPIKSRLMTFYFAALKDDDMKTLAYKVIKAENLSMTDEAVELLVELSDRDTRVLLNTLQVCALLGKEITLDTVRNTLQVPDKKQVTQMIDSAINGDLDLAFEIGSNHIIGSGFDISKIIRMIDKNLSTLDVHPNTKGALLNVISDTEDRINHGGTPDIQLRALLANFALITKVPSECPAMKK